MRTTISSILLRNAVGYVQTARSSHAAGRVEDEIRASVGAHLMASLAIEGVGNEVGEVALDTWVWRGVERLGTPLKWYLLSGFRGHKNWDPDSEPLQSIQQLTTVRNRIAHPKIQDLGTEIIVRSSDGKIRRNFGSNETPEPGDQLFVECGKLFDEFNADSADQAVRKALTAIRALRTHLTIAGLEWVEQLVEQLGTP